jgi:predicted RNase H-like HicB family nuclease
MKEPQKTVLDQYLTEKSVSLNVVYRKYEDGGIVAECLDIPGCMSQGESEEEAKTNIIKAIEACLSVMFEDRMKATSERRGQYNNEDTASLGTISIALMPSLEEACR